MKYLNLITHKNQVSMAQSAVELLIKYAKNSNFGTDTYVSFVVDSNCVGDAYRIDVKEKEILIFSNSPVGFNAAVGYLVRHQQTAIENQNITFNSDFRAVYFAIHFYNYYHSAPTEEICEYLESLALWGQNTLTLWFDMHHFESLSDPAAEKMIEKMLCLFRKAKSLGMKTSISRLPNEYYVGAKSELLAENKVESGRYRYKLCGFYYTELCPSKQQAEALLMSSFEELLSRLSEVGLDYIILWPYDQGGCTCKDCYPWGANGFYKIAKKQAIIAKKFFPNIEIIFSCWRFDHFTTGEWDQALERIRNDDKWIDRLMVDIDAPLPEALATFGMPIVSFPEISMYNCSPWGGFGVNPFPEALAKQFQKTQSYCRGGALYSEGIYEDINKTVALELMRDPNCDPKQTVIDYCIYHFGNEYGTKIADIVLRLEATLKRIDYYPNGERCEYPYKPSDELYTFDIENKQDVEPIALDFAAIHANLPAEVKKNWRYIQIYARVMADEALVKNSGVPSKESDDILSPLINIYHAQRAYYFVCPVTRDSIMENRGEGI